MIRVLFFASLRERLGTAQESIAADGIASVADVISRLRAADPARAEALSPQQAVIAAVNQEMARADTPVADGDEVAFFPPVTGG
ncbi:MAG: molybdopterin converting factor subunit 1 [Thiohalocapsa sp.]|jgi:molybdopterin synthase sulfur carrier subunit|nr:molybdopterin converting factor subunit 1 [Thiohalocapsa sp.]